jgi:glycosyltransferase involved in cell wall biosynthesis
VELGLTAVARVVSARTPVATSMARTGGKKLLSVVTPCYNEEASIVHCYETVRDILANELPEYDYEHIIADNASTDMTLDLLRDIAGRDPRVKVIANARNFGPMRSHFNALLAASGDVVVVFIPADLQDPPELIPQFVRLWEHGHDVVYGIRAVREEGVAMRWLRSMFYRLVTLSNNFHIPPDVGDFQVIDKKVLQALRQFGDQYPYLRGMIFYCGFPSIGVPYTWKRRERGISNNRLSSLIDQGLNGWLTFSNFPLRLAMIAGVGMASLSGLYGLIILAKYLISSQPPAEPGITTIILALLMFSGIQLFILGLIGEYVGSINTHTRRHPRVVERERINFGAGSTSPQDEAKASSE